MEQVCVCNMTQKIYLKFHKLKIFLHHQISDAWTETDNTVYTLSCAGSEGFLRLLPVYLDHILFPTLTKSGFITEIYSVTKEGEDNGAVYCEMQGRENSGESRSHLELLRNIYPNHGYSKVKILN